MLRRICESSLRICQSMCINRPTGPIYPSTHICDTHMHLSSMIESTSNQPPWPFGWLLRWHQLQKHSATGERGTATTAQKQMTDARMMDPKRMACRHCMAGAGDLPPTMAEQLETSSLHRSWQFTPKMLGYHCDLKWLRTDGPVSVCAGVPINDLQMIYLNIFKYKCIIAINCTCACQKKTIDCVIAFILIRRGQPAEEMASPDPVWVLLFL